MGQVMFQMKLACRRVEKRERGREKSGTTYDKIRAVFLGEGNLTPSLKSTFEKKMNWMEDEGGGREGGREGGGCCADRGRHIIGISPTRE
jgi:hypothetical protein